MRRPSFLPLLLVVLSGAAIAQNENTAVAGSDAPHQDLPAIADAAGVFERGSGLVLPRFLAPITVTYPGSAPLAEPPLNCTVSLVVGTDGTAGEAKVIRSLVPQVDERAVRELLRARYEPGTLDGKPVPMRVFARIHFMVGEDTATPRLTWVGRGPESARGPQSERKWDTPPIAIRTTEAEFSEEARRQRVEGTVLVSLTVNEKGMPEDIQIEKGLGAGLSEKAVEAVRQYRFKPATRDGAPIPARISVEIRFSFRN